MPSTAARHCAPLHTFASHLHVALPHPAPPKGDIALRIMQSTGSCSSSDLQNSSCRCAHEHPRLLRAASWTVFRLMAYSDATTTARAVASCCVQLSRIESAAPGVDGELLMPPQREASVATGRGGPGAVQGRSMSITQNQTMLESIARRSEGA